MAHELLRLMTSVCNKPQLVTEAYFDKVVQILNERTDGKELVILAKDSKKKERHVTYNADSGVGIVDIDGPLTAVSYEGICGEMGVSHLSIRQEVRQLIEMGATTIVLDQSSPGGEAHMTFETANYIRDLADENGVKLISYISELSASASYAYSAVAHEVIINPSAEAGSIGVRVRLRNTNGYMRSLGIEDVYITAGDGKVPFDSEGKFTQEFLDDIQEQVLELYDQFTDHVAMWRGLEKDKVVALGAKVYTAKKALENGLVDKIMTLEEFKSYLETDHGEEMANPLKNLLKGKDNKEMSDDVQTNLQAQVSELEASLKEKISEFESIIAEKDAKLEELSANLKAALDAKKETEAELRVKALSEFLGEDQAKEMAITLEALSDDAFSKAVAGMKAVYAAADDDLEKELGDQGEEVKEAELSYAEKKAKALKEQYKNQQ